MMGPSYENGKEECKISKVSVSGFIFKYSIKYWGELKWENICFSTRITILKIKFIKVIPDYKAISPLEY